MHCTPGSNLPGCLAVMACVFAAAHMARGQCGYDATIIEAPPAQFGSLINGRALNDAGHACGHFDVGFSGQQEAFVWTGGSKVTPLEPARGIIESNAADLANGGGVNGADVVAGSYNLDDGMLRAFVHDGSQFFTLDPLPGGDWSFGEGINDNLHVAGDSHNFEHTIERCRCLEGRCCSLA